MKYGLSEKQLGEIIDFIAQYPEVETAVLFGSRALGTYKEASDVDIALLGEKVNHSLAAKMKFNIEEDTYLPFMFDFVAYPTITNDALRKHIDTKGVVIFRRGEREWIETKLSKLVATNVASVGSDYPFTDILYLDTGSVTRGKIDGYQKLKIDKAPSRARRLVKENDIVYSTVRPIQRHYGFITSPAENLVVSTGFAVVSCNPEKLNPKYLYYYLTSDQIVEELDIIAEASTTTYPSLKPSDIEGLELRLPKDTKEQKAIASVLSSLDDKIDLLHRQKKTLEAMAETLFRQWFVEETQEDWEEAKLGDLFDISSGKGLKRDLFNDAGVIPVLGANGEIGRTNYYLFEEKLIFTGRVGTLGNIFIVNGDKVWLSDNTLVFRKIRWFYFVYFILKSSHLEDFNVGSTQPLVRQSDIKEIPVNIPSNYKLGFFEDSVSHLFEKMEDNKNQIRTLEKLRDTLLPKLMSGEVRVDYEDCRCC